MHDLNVWFALVIGAGVNIRKAVAKTLAASGATAKRQVMQ